MNDVAGWLERIGLGVYADAFVENAIDRSLLPELTNEDLKDLGVALVGHRRRILKEIADIDAAPVAAPQREAATSAERRQVSVLFCDLVGSTALSTQLDAEDIREVQRMYQDAVARAVNQYGGHIASFVGDGVAVYFGWPIASEDQVERAVRAGRAALELIAKLTIPDRDETLAARAGIATGNVVVGDLAGELSHQTAAISGKAPNRAARVQSLAEPGQLVIDDKTQMLLRASFELVDLGTHDLKGLEPGVRAWRVENEAAIDSRFDAASGARSVTPLVGRKGDLDLILDRWAQTQAGEGQVVMLAGEAGIGKSRMIKQLYQRLEDDPKTILRYQCLHYFDNAALRPVAATLEKAAGFARSDTDDQKLAKLDGLLAPTARGVDQTAALLATLLGLPVEDRYPPLGMTPQRQLEETLQALVEQALAVAENAPALIVFEDLHWADPTTIDLIGRLIVAAQGKPIFLLLTSRNEFTAPWPAYPHLTSLSLNRLGRADCDAMIDRLTHGKPLPNAIKAQIAEKADGVPLFVEELTKTVLEAGYVVETETAYLPKAGLLDLAIPSTLQDTLMARLDQQSRVKNVAQIGACIGRDFTYEVLSAVADMLDATLGQVLDQLARAEIVFRQGVPPLSTYSFKHALLRDAAYDSLLRSRKRELHSQIVAHLERQQNPDVIGCAMHSAAAGLSDKAARYFLAAGRASLTAATFGEAISQFNLALEQIAKMDAAPARDRLELDVRLALGAAEMSSNGWAADTVKEALLPAVPLAKALEDNIALGVALFSIWIYHGTRSEMDEALDWIAQLDAAAAEHQSQDLEMIADAAGSMNFFWISDFERADARRIRVKKNYVFEKHRHLVEFMNHDPFATVLQWGGGTQLWCQGLPDQAAEAIAEAVAHERRLEHPFSVIHGLTLGSLAMMDFGAGEALVAQCEEASRICDDIGLPFMKVVSCDSVRGRALISLRRDEEGVATLTEAVALWEAIGGRTAFGEYTTRLATGLGRLSRFEDALTHNNKALEHAVVMGDRWYEPETHRVQATLLMGMPDPQIDRGLEHLAKAREMAAARGALSFELRAAITHAEHLETAGQRAEATAVLEPVFARFTEGFGTPDLMQAKAMLERLA